MTILAELAAREVGAPRSTRYRTQRMRRQTQHSSAPTHRHAPRAPHWALPRSLSLHDLAASCPSIKRSCVLGFSRDGDHLLGYSRDVDPERGSFVYALKVWRIWRHKVNGAEVATARDLLQAPLFGEARFSEDSADEVSHAADLLITIGESVDQSWLVVVGVELSSDEAAPASSAVRHLTVLRSPIPADRPHSPSAAEDPSTFLLGSAVYSSSDLVSPPFGALDLETWWMKPGKEQNAERLVMNRGDEIDVFYLRKHCGSTCDCSGHCRGATMTDNDRVSPSKDAAASKPSTQAAAKQHAVPLHCIAGCWSRQSNAADSQCPQSHRRAQRQQFDRMIPSSASGDQCHNRCGIGRCVGNSVVERYTFHTERLLTALFQRRQKQGLPAVVRVLDYNMQLLQALDHRTISAVLIVSISVCPRRLPRPQQHRSNSSRQCDVQRSEFTEVNKGNEKLVDAAPAGSSLCSDSCEPEVREETHLVVIDIANGSCGSLPFKFSSTKRTCSGKTKLTSGPSCMLEVADHALMLQMRALLAPIYSGLWHTDSRSQTGWPNGLSQLGTYSDVPLATIWDNLNVVADHDHFDQRGANIAKMFCHRRHRKRRRRVRSSGGGCGAAEQVRARVEEVDEGVESVSLSEIVHPSLPLLLRW